MRIEFSLTISEAAEIAETKDVGSNLRIIFN